jgi:tetratricopeptide (TPR) repeat protein
VVSDGYKKMKMKMKMVRIILVGLAVLYGQSVFAETLEQRADSAFNQQKFSDAARLYARLLHGNPGHRDYSIQLATSYQILGKHQKSIELAKVLAEQNPRDKEAWSMLAINYLALGNVQEAHHFYQKLIEFYPDDPGAYLGLGNVLLHLGDNDAASDAFDTYQLLTDQSQ